MRYTESLERSAEVLRVALSHMGQHAAAYNPITFAVWYEFSAGINPALSRAVEAALRTEPQLGDDTVRRLHRDFVADADNKTVRQISDKLQRVMSGMAESASRTGEQASAFSDQVDGFAAALQTSRSPALAPLIGEVTAGAAQMKVSALALEQEVRASHEEIVRLRVDLSRAREEALLDSLTQVLNRKGFDQMLQAMWAREPGPGKAHCLILLDIDHFKAVNDQHGHVMGDRVIQAVGEVLRHCASDPSQSIARYGGEEFAILMPSSTLQDALRLAETVRTCTKAMKLRDRRTRNVVLTITISAGVAAASSGDETSCLIARADRALYRSKQSGRDRVSSD
jgi:diguanylate cyclase